MKITVFEASGGIGTHVVDLAGQRGHQVRAVYRATPETPPDGQAEILVSPDIFDPAFAGQAIRGADVVVTALGPNFATRPNPRTTMTSPPDLHQRLARTLTAAMKDPAAPARLISVSTGSMGPGDPAMGAPRGCCSASSAPSWPPTWAAPARISRPWRKNSPPAASTGTRCSPSS